MNTYGATKVTGVNYSITSSLKDTGELALAVDSSANEILDPAVLTSLPAGAIPLVSGSGNGGQAGGNGIDVMPLGVGAGTFVIDLVGLFKVGDNFIPRPLYRAVVTLGEIPYDDEDRLFASSIASPTIGTEGSECITTAGDPAAVYVDTKGCSWLAPPQFDCTGGVDSANAIIRRV